MIHKIRFLGGLVFLFFITSCGMNDRVKDAYAKKEQIINQKMIAKGISRNSPVFLRAFKSEKVLELWMNSGNDWILYDTYPICKVPGKPGPKKKEGDRQVPEGVYYINRFNPKSSYLLSLGINYPNEFDSSFADKANPGSDIFIHGKCVSVGCIPVTDDKIREIYILASEAKENGQDSIPVHIFPFRMTQENMQSMKSAHPEHSSFWDNLRPIYDYFEQNKKTPRLSITAEGYLILP